MTTSSAMPALLTRGRLKPLTLAQVRITDGIWKELADRVQDVVIASCDARTEQVGWVENLRELATGATNPHRGWLFADSDVYKVAEAMAWQQALPGGERWTERLGELADVIGRAQSDDGYINSAYGREGQPERYSNMEYGHELYCAGHLIQAGVASARSGGPVALLDAAVRVADHICEIFGPDGRVAVCGHPEVETALVELYRETGEQRYLRQAELFVSRRGRGLLADELRGGRDYYQDATPVRQQTVLVGHAVRALYLHAGAIDIAVETGDDDFLDVLRAQFDQTLATKTYLTGGMGSRHSGEAFGEEFELPNDRAYAETCAAVAAIHVAWRLLLVTGEPSYADYIETALYNSVLPSPSVTGDSFFYVNTLHRRVPGVQPSDTEASVRRTDGLRARWFTVSCCPTNISRLVSTLGAYLATHDDDGVQLHQYFGGRVAATGPDGEPRTLEVETRFPEQGRVRVVVTETDEAPWTLTLRVPAWSQRTAVSVNGEPVAVEGALVRVRRTWAAGDEVVLDLDLTPRWVHPHPEVDASRGCVAALRGPLVYALESVDNPGADVNRVGVRADAPLVVEAAEMPWGRTTLLRTAGAEVVPPADERTSGYEDAADRESGRPRDLRLLPYYLWANRGASTMRVWLPVREQAAGQG
ncbi:MAG: beta-L-arabinofuranosidase domain-containing protein [Cellulomonas sp.]